MARLFLLLGMLLLVLAGIAGGRTIWDLICTNKSQLAPLAALMGLTLVGCGLALPHSPMTDNKSPPKFIYGAVQGYAHLVKAILQMAIGVAALAVVGWKFLQHPRPLHAANNEQTATFFLLDGIGVGLAAAAVVELTYTLFTEGPDEALDPLMLGVSAAILIQLGGMRLPVSFGQAGALLALGVLLAVLFATKLMLTERHDKEDPKGIWWIERMKRSQDASDRT
jgi:hypothetical protein